MHRSNRDDACKRALRESFVSNGRNIISLENTTSNKKTKVQNYEILFHGLLESQIIREEFDEEFEEYQLHPGRSYVKITSILHIFNKSDNSMNTLCQVIVKYCNDYRPYSSELSFRQLMNKNAELNRIIESLKTSYRELYLKNGNEECPVCYCSLKTENIELPVCVHAICKSCFTKCDKCPLCRTGY